jgi:hypothetical protein
MMATRTTIRRGDESAASRGDCADRVWFCLSKTINTGNYESIRLEYGQGRALGPGESPESAKDLLITHVVQTLLSLEEEVRRLMAKT